MRVSRNSWEYFKTPSTSNGALSETLFPRIAAPWNCIHTQYSAATFARSQPHGTVYVGLSMKEAGIDDGDLLVVDRYMKPQHRSVIVAVIDNDSARWGIKQ
jgi:hypothetical protein